MPKERGIVRKLQKGKAGNFLLTVPSQLVLAFGWEAGDELEWRIVGPGKFELTRSRRGASEDKDAA